MAGVFFVLAGSFFTYINPGHDTMMLNIALLPAMFYFITRGAGAEKLIYYLLAGVMLGLSAFVSLYQMTLYSAVSMTVYFVFVFFSEKKKAKHLLYFCGTVIITFLFSAIQLFQSFYFQRFTFRTSVNYEFFSSWSLHPLETIVYIYPKFFGFLESTYWGRSAFWIHNDYMGIIPWIFVFTAVLFVFKSSKVKFFICMAIGTMLLAYGGFTPIHKLLFKIPVINGFRSSNRWLGFFAFSIITLSAFGFEYIKNYFTAKKEPQEPGKMRSFLKVLLIVLATALGIYFLFSSSQSAMVNNLKGLAQFNTRFPAQNLDYVANIIYLMIKDDMFLFVLYFSIGISLVYMVVKGKIGKGLFFAACLLMVFLDNGVRFMAPRTFNVGGNEYKIQCVKTEPADQEDPRRIEIRDFLSRDKSYYRVMPVGDLFNKNWFIEDKIQSCGGYHSAPLENYTTAQSKGLLNDFRFISLLNAKYLLSETVINHPYMKLVNDGKVKIYENVTVMPRVMLFSKTLVLDKDKMYARMVEPVFNPISGLILNEEIKEPLDNIIYSGKEVNIAKYEDSEIEIETESAGNSMLFLSEVFYPEWKAYVDGKETKIYQAYGLFRTIYLPKGKHKVLFKWDPKIFHIGAVLTLSALCFILLYGFFQYKRREEPGKNKKQL